MYSTTKTAYEGERGVENLYKYAHIICERPLRKLANVRVRSESQKKDQFYYLI